MKIDKMALFLVFFEVSGPMVLQQCSLQKVAIPVQRNHTDFKLSFLVATATQVKIESPD